MKQTTIILGLGLVDVIFKDNHISLGLIRTQNYANQSFY